MESYFYSQLYYMDYIYFGMGFAFLSLGILLYIFTKDDKVWLRSRNTFLIILFLFSSSLALWSDLFLLQFPQSLFEHLVLIFSTISTISLLEYGRRMILNDHKKLNLLLLLYIVPFVLLYLKQTTPFYMDLFKAGGLLVAALGFYSWITKRKSLNTNEQKGLYLATLYIGLAMLYLMATLLEKYYMGSLTVNRYVFFFYSIEWLYTFSLSLGILHFIIKTGIREPLEIQLKHIKFWLSKAVIVTLAFVYILGYFFVNYLEEEQLNQDKENLLSNAEFALLSINSEVLLWDHTLKVVQDSMHNRVLVKLTEIQKMVKFKNSPYILDSNGEGVMFSLDNSNIQLLNSKRDINDVFMSREAIIRQGDKNNLIVFAPIKNQENMVVGLLGINLLHEEEFYAPAKHRRLGGMAIVLIVFIGIIALANIYYINHREAAWKGNYDKILSSIADIVGVFDEKGNIIYANKAAFTLTGFHSQRQGKSNIRSFVSSEDGDKILNLMNGLQRNEVVHSEFNMIRRNGSTLPVYGSMSYLDYEHNHSLFVFTAVNISEQKKREKEIREQYQNTLELLATLVDAKDDYTARHSSNVARYARAIAMELNLSQEEINEIETAAFVHDIGKIGVPDHVLKKAGPLTDTEWFEMKMHPEYGRLILEKAGTSFEKMIPYVYHHHERFDGKGYPSGLKEPDIKIGIISVADTFDAMTSNRSYRKKLRIKDAIEELRKHSGTQFHPEVVKAFMAVLEREQDEILLDKIG